MYQYNYDSDKMEMVNGINKFFGVESAIMFLSQGNSESIWFVDDKEVGRLKISYDILNSASKFKFFAPCVKHYLAPQVKTSFMKVAPTEWDIALFLPLQQFIGAGKQKVWADSRKIIRGR